MLRILAWLVTTITVSNYYTRKKGHFSWFGIFISTVLGLIVLYVFKN